MSIIDLQRRNREAGRVRFGERVPMANGKSRPGRLEHPRFTSSDEELIRQIATLYGGEVQPWASPAGAQFEVYVSADRIQVALLPDATASQFYELWSGGGCSRRCDGAIEAISDGPCLCDPDARECKITTRFAFLLPGIRSTGVWRAESHGYYSAIEIPAQLELAALLRPGQLVPATLRVESRTVVRDGKKKNFPVVTLDLGVDVASLAWGSVGTARAIEASAAPRPTATPLAPEPAVFTPIAPSAPQPVASAVSEVERAVAPKPRGGKVPIPEFEIPEFEDFVATPVIPLDDEEEFTVPPITPDQIKKLKTVFNVLNWPDRKQQHAFAKQVLNKPVATFTKLTKDEARKVIDALDDLATSVEVYAEETYPEDIPVAAPAPARTATLAAPAPPPESIVGVTGSERAHYQNLLGGILSKSQRANPLSLPEDEFVSIVLSHASGGRIATFPQIQTSAGMRKVASVIEAMDKGVLCVTTKGVELVS
ncbi:MAG: recombination directionality factor [Ferrimicrobium sp.]